MVVALTLRLKAKRSKQYGHYKYESETAHGHNLQKNEAKFHTST
jgi:hypothetical protein